MFFVLENIKYMKNVLLYLSAFIPMYLLILIKQIIEMIVGNLKFNFLNIFVCAILMILIASGFIGLKFEIFNETEIIKEITVTSKTNTTDEHFLGYFSLFVLFSITFDLSKVSMLVVFILIISMIGVVYVKNKLFYINPLLNILGFNFYEIEYKIRGGDGFKSIKIFYKGDLTLNKKYKIKIKDENFNFLIKK